MDSTGKLAWKKYSAENLQRCLEQARSLEEHLMDLRGKFSGLLALDFMCFDESRRKIEKLAKYLARDYSITVVECDNGKYWTAEGKLPPMSVEYILEHHSLKWVEVMCDLARSYGCTFSSWQFTDLSTLRAWNNSGSEQG